MFLTILWISLCLVALGRILSDLKRAPKRLMVNGYKIVYNQSGEYWQVSRDNIQPVGQFDYFNDAYVYCIGQ